MTSAPPPVTPIFYHIYVRSFRDSNHDGIGDLKGILEVVDYIAGLGVNYVLLSPIFPTLNKDFGYDVTDYNAINPEFGTMDDFRELLDAFGKVGIKVAIDIPLAHSSDKHPWFQESREAHLKWNKRTVTQADVLKKDYYIWSKTKKKPNNWRTLANTSGWVWDKEVKAWYLVSFLDCQPRLNLRNKFIRDNVKQILGRWAEMGVAGFRLDMASAFFTDKDLRDNPWTWRFYPTDEDTAVFQHSKMTLNLPETFEFFRELRQHLDDEEKIVHHPIFLIGEVFAKVEDTRRFRGLDAVFNPAFMGSKFTKRWMTAFLTKTMLNTNSAVQMAFPLSSHDRARIIERLQDENKVKTLAVLQFTIPSIVPFIYYGDEIGLGHPEIPFSEAQDPLGKRWTEGKIRFPFLGRSITFALPLFLRQFLVGILERFSGEVVNRDKARGLMPWGDKSWGKHTWVSSECKRPDCPPEVLVDDPLSLYNFFRKLVEIRKTYLADAHPVVFFLDTKNKHVLAYEVSTRQSQIVVYLNLSPHKIHAYDVQLPIGDLLLTSDPKQQSFQDDIDPYEVGILKLY